MLQPQTPRATPGLPSGLSPAQAQELALEAVAIGEELERRRRQREALWDLRKWTELLYPQDDDRFHDFWKRFGEPQEWLLSLCLAWKLRQTSFEVMPGFTVVINGRERKVERPESFNLSSFKTLLILQSRETLKTGIRRIDASHDLAFYPLVRGEPCTVAWFAHKLEEAIRNGEAIKKALCASPEFNKLWGGIITPTHGSWQKWGRQEYFNTPIHPDGMPERSMSFLAVKTRYEGGRYKAGHFDDLVTGEDRDSLATREEKKRNIKDRENERDRTVGYRIIQGTPWHSQDAYQELERQEGVITFKLPCVAGDPKKFFEFYDLDKKLRRKHLAEYTEECKPVFKHLDLMTLVESCDQQKPRLFASQMLLSPGIGGQQVFDTNKLVWLDSIEQVPSGLPGCLFCDPAFKKPDNKYEGDYNAIGQILFDSFGRLIVCDGAYRNDWQESDVFQEAGRLIKTWMPQLFFMEQKFQGDINKHWQDFAFKNGIKMPYIQPLKQAGHANKHTRIVSLEPLLDAGKIVLVKGSPICLAIENEMKGYDAISGSAGHDDALDMLAQATDENVPRYDETWQKDGWATEEEMGKQAEEPQPVWMP